MGSSYVIYGYYYGFRTFLLLAWRVVFEVYKNVGEKPAHPLRNYWKNSFVLCKTYWCFHLTQACRLTLLNSFHDASTVSKELWPFCLQDYAFRIGPKYNYFLTSTLSYLLSVNKGNIARTYLISLCTRRRKNNFQPPEWVLWDQVFQATRGSIFQVLVMELDFAGLLILLPPPRAKQNKISPPNKSCKERKNSSNS